MRTKTAFLTAIALAALLSAPGRSSAQSDAGVLRGWGPQIGISSGPDQAYLGAHFDLGRLTPRLHLRPGVELGIGGRSESFAGNIDVGYRLRDSWQAWAPYVGGGVGVLIRGRDDHFFSGGRRSDFGFGALFGISRGLGAKQFYLEARLGLLDQPDMKIGMGWTFY